MGEQVVELQIWKGDASAEHALSLLLDGIEVEIIVLDSDVTPEDKERALETEADRSWLMCTGDAGARACRLDMPSSS